MAKKKFSYWDYVKEAFHLKIAVPALGEMPLNKLALTGFGILGFGHPGFWLLGLAYEAGYLLCLPGNERFQKVIQGRTLQKTKHQVNQQKDALFYSLDKEARKRFSKLSEKAKHILETSKKTSSNIGLGDLKSVNLSQLLWIFLKLLASRQRIDGILSQETLHSELEEEIKTLSKRIAETSDSGPMKRSLQGTLEIQQRRLENLTKASESKRVIEAELDRIEKQVTMLAEELAISGDPSHFSMRLDGVMQSLQETSKWMSSNAEFFQSVSEEEVSEELLSSPPIMTEFE